MLRGRCVAFDGRGVSVFVVAASVSKSGGFREVGNDTMKKTDGSLRYSVCYVCSWEEQFEQ
jgi:hypothetical protein